MRKSIFRTWYSSDILLSLFVLALLLAFTYAIFFLAPYSGFYFHPTDGRVLLIYVKADPEASLQVGDVLDQIGPVPWSSYYENGAQVLFEDVQPGQIVDIVVRRNSLTLTVPWVFPGFNRQEFENRFLNIWWLPYIFWFFGVVTQLFMRPKDARWRLLIAANYLTGLFLIFGSLSAWRIWESSLLLHAMTWLCVPVYLNLHWIFPKPLGRVPTFVWGILYLVGGALAVSEFLQVLPRTFYFLGFLVMLLGSIALLIVHVARQPAQRREVGLLAIAILIALAPSISLGISGMFGSISNVYPLALLTLPIMPGAYFYGVYRRQLGGLELRANRIIALIVYGALFLAIAIPAVFAIDKWVSNSEAVIVIGLVFTLLAILTTASAYPYFQHWVEHRLLGMPLPPAHVLESYTARIATSVDIEQLKRVINDEVMPSLLIRQAALLRLEGDQGPIPICTLGVTEAQLPKPAEIPALLAESGKVRLPLSEAGNDLPCPWARLVLALTLEGKPVGLCLFGRRDPDDFYAAIEIPTLQALMDQTALALLNIKQAEYLHALYKADIERQETERSRLALELHDDVLGQMAMLTVSMGDYSASPQFNQAYQSATKHIRQIVNGLRPAMLNYGLRSALIELADEARALGAGTTMRVELPPSEVRYPPMMELHLFRIIQQACQNALQHAKAKAIRITGSLEPEQAELVVEDDGVGFAAGEHLDLAGLLANKHFGLAGMHERAALIGAKMAVESDPGQGTRVRVIWNLREASSDNSSVTQKLSA